MPVDQATADRLRTHDWGGDPFEASGAAGEPYRTRLVNGRCFFLDQENRCRIHVEISYDAKPAVCRGFPLSVLEVGGRQYARLSFWCPTVVDNAGKPLDHQARWLKDTAKHSDHRTAPLMINATTAIQPREFERVHQVLRRFLRDPSLSIGDRLAAASVMIGRLDAASEGANGGAAGNVAEQAESEGAAALAADARRRAHPSAARRVLSLYLLQDRRDGRFPILVRFVSILLFNAGITRLQSRAVPGRASWRQVRRVAFRPSEAGAELLARYFCSKIDSRRYVAGDATLVTGVNLLVAAYGIINVLARMRAASEGRPSCNDEDLRLAVRAADLLVVEHPGLYQGAVHRRLTEAALGSPELCGGMLARLDPRP